jgi:uncharacterized protein YecT (DUF1311 family)
MKFPVYKFSTLFRTFAILPCFCFIPCAVAQKLKPISTEEIVQWLYKNGDCPADQPPPRFHRLDYFDFKGDGNKEAIVVAATCMSGTGGPDIHSVFGRDSDGEVEELKIAEVDPKTYDNLFGNRNYDLVAENGLLVANVEDDSARTKIPLIIRYKWNGKEFAVDSIHKTGVYPTSYDCTKAAKGAVEDAICHVEELAALDLQLGAAYKALIAKLSAADRETLKTEQRAWLADRDKRCAPYKAWIGCITDFYQKRIEELKKVPAPVVLLRFRSTAGTAIKVRSLICHFA